MICISDAPNDFAASIILGSTFLKLFSKSLAIKGADATLKGITAAVSPIEVFNINLVKGMMETANIIKGTDLRILIITSSIPYTILLGFNPSLPVYTRTMASTNAILTEITMESTVI